MQRVVTILGILVLTFIFDKVCASQESDWYLQLNDLFPDKEFTFLIFGIVVGGIYWLKFGTTLSHMEQRGYPYKKVKSIYYYFPGKKYFLQLGYSLWGLIKKTFFGRYLTKIYAPPVNSEQVLGGFFFGKTLITTAIAFYSVEWGTLFGILLFSSVFDSLTGIYQHTLMNFFHLSLFKNRMLAFCQNLIKRYALDVLRAEIIILILLGMETFTVGEQYHILKNRLVSATYYFNAVIIDRLVDMGAISRNFRSRFVIFASTVGGMLCLLDFARTEFPRWIPAETIAQIPSWMPGPLALLGLFNLSIFVVAGGLFLWARSANYQYKSSQRSRWV